jgi:hypothetical protein
MVYRPEWYQKGKNHVKYPYPSSIKTCEILITDTQMVSKKTIPLPTMVSTAYVYTYHPQRFDGSRRWLASLGLPTFTNHIFPVHVTASNKVNAQFQNLFILDSVHLQDLWRAVWQIGILRLYIRLRVATTHSPHPYALDMPLGANSWLVLLESSCQLQFEFIHLICSSILVSFVNLLEVCRRFGRV